MKFRHVGIAISLSLSWRNYKTKVLEMTNLKTIQYNAAFEKISEEKRNKILEAATLEFSEHNFESANINHIAKRSGISIGSMYSYFNSKEELFYTVVHHAVSYLGLNVQDIASNEGDLFQKIEAVLQVIQSTSRTNEPMVRLYSQLTCENRMDLIERIVSEIESITAELYSRLLKDAQARGEIRDDINPRLFAFFLDNLFISLQFSYCSTYYKERLRVYVGEELFEQDELVAQQLMKFIRGALMPILL